MYVVVPPGDEAQSVSCPICKESLKAEFLEDDEDWVWRNAVRKDDKVCVTHDSRLTFLALLVSISLTDLSLYPFLIGVPCDVPCGSVSLKVKSCREATQ